MIRRMSLAALFSCACVAPLQAQGTQAAAEAAVRGFFGHIQAQRADSAIALLGSDFRAVYGEQTVTRENMREMLARATGATMSFELSAVAAAVADSVATVRYQRTQREQMNQRTSTETAHLRLRGGKWLIIRIETTTG